MDSYNMSNILRIIDDDKHKIKKLCAFDIDDPWYTGNFELVYKQINEAIDKLL